jgi:TRAP-type mannitol/chloroaromatic compound transport system substrate-binding protein
MKGSTVLIAIVSLIVGLIIGVFALSSGSDSTKPSGQNMATNDMAVTEPVRWKMTSSYSGNLILLGTQGLFVEERIRTLSNGTMELKYFDPGALVPALEVFDAVSTGAVNAGWTGSGYWAGKVPALQFFTAVPFGPGAGEVLAWMYYGGGLELMQEIYARHNIFSQPCSLISPEGSGWFTKEITSLDDLKGLKMRFFGLGAKVMEKLGVSTQLLAAGDIFPALELGTIDAAEFSNPAIDLDLGFYQVAKHYYFPGWHQPISMIELMVNLDDWNSLSATQQQIIDSVCKESILQSFAQGEAIQFSALQELESKGVIIHRWSPDILEALENAWNEVVAEEAQKDADFARVWAALSDFRENYKIWGDLAYLD